MHSNLLKKLFTLIHEKMNIDMNIDHYLYYIQNTEDRIISIYKIGVTLINEPGDFKVLPTTYEVLIDIETKELVFCLGNIEIAREKYIPREMLAIFNDDQIIEFIQPTSNDIEQYLKIYNLLKPQIFIGKESSLKEIYEKIQEAEIIEGRFYEIKEEQFHFIEIIDDQGTTKIKEMKARNYDLLTYALNGGGDLKQEYDQSTYGKEVFEYILQDLIYYAKYFNQELQMSLQSIEKGLMDYDEILKVYKE